MTAHMADHTALYLYLGLIALVTGVTAAASLLFPSHTHSPEKFMPYESGILTETNLLKERFPLRHYLVALIFLVFDVEVIFLYPWAVIAKEIGPFAFYEMLFFLVVTGVGFSYIWKKGGLEWE